ncbi:Gfo/Idh/MocA family protein [Paenibacillus arenilitoris]|uniref:Gfo/Idh/MocA family oxidoreductase n=1 Tax=Paenibacillus arenilitoris TaxID=2772299 RepID=A0A927CVY0_9BACL|nr:Gfo/Idh/MocA family oxidoreductase [Paenibacillus arenilitoris]MBD2872816.1 Gfo/Idh/MocA family oxidoreductase [Paenibacillus arenilitoris]
MSKLRIGFVGTGGMGQMAHLSNYAQLAKECEVVAIAEPRAEQAKLVAGRYGIAEIYADHRELIAKARVDAIVAAQPYRRHSIIVPDILQSGIPVFTEKPLSLTVEAGERLVRLGEERGTLHMVGYHKRSDPAIEYAKAVVDRWKESGELGRMTYVRVSMPPGDWVAGADAPLESGEPRPSDELEPFGEAFDAETNRKYDEFVNYYIHQVNLIRHMLGEPYRLAYADPSGILLTGTSDSGVCAVLEMGAYRTTVEWHESVFVAFEQGFVKAELPPPLARQQAGRVTVMKDAAGGSPEYVVPVLPNVHAMRKQAQNFLAAVRGERPAPCEAREALEDHRLAEAYIRAMYPRQSENF